MTSFTPLSPSLLLLLYVRSALQFLLFWAPLLTLGGIALVSGTMNEPALATVGLQAIWFATLSFTLLHTLWLPYLHFNVLGYALREKDLLVRRGVVFRTIHALPLGRIQHVDTHRGPVERLFGLATLNIYTASGGGADAIIPGLTEENAALLRDALLDKAEGDDGV
jgi:membrane protein YdbS with pleckstrin-like domain